MVPRWTLTALLLVASVAAMRSPHYSLRERPPSNCGFAHYGSTAGSAQRLVETHLAPGVADWNIVVPMPPPCAEAQVMGADMRVCDSDAPPDVAMSDAWSARVHRTGQLAGFATVNVTVYCILLPPPPPPTPPPPSPPHPPPPPPPLPTPSSTTISIAPPLLHLTDSRSTYETISNELGSKEVTSNEETSNESESIDLKSTELTTTAKPTSSTTLSMTQEETTAQAELTPPTAVVTAPPNKTTRPKEKIPHSQKVTINTRITPTNQVSTEEDVSQSYGVELPSLSIKEKPDEMMSLQSPRLSSVPNIVTPPRMSAMPPWKYVKQLHRPGSPAQPAAAPHRPPGAFPHPGAHQQPGAHWPSPRPRLQPPYYPPVPQYSPMPSPYNLMSPYSLAPLYRPFSLLSPRLTVLQRRQPLLFFRHF